MPWFTALITRYGWTYSNKYYAEHKCELSKSDLDNGALQYAWTNHGRSLLVTINVYPTKSKFLVQPGDQQEENLLEWVSVFSHLLPKLEVHTNHGACSINSNSKQENCGSREKIETPQPSIPSITSYYTFLVVKMPPPQPIVN